MLVHNVMYPWKVNNSNKDATNVPRLNYRVFLLAWWKGIRILLEAAAQSYWNIRSLAEPPFELGRVWVITRNCV